MPKKDYAQIAHAVYLQSIGEAPVPPRKDEQHATAGRAGGSVTAGKLTPEQRKLKAQNAANARWHKS